MGGSEITNLEVSKFSREEQQNKIREELAIQSYNTFKTNIALWLPTGTGKSAIALKCCKQVKNPTVLIVVEKLIHKKNWLKEIEDFNNEVIPTFVHYESLSTIKNEFDFIIYDEADSLVTDNRLQNAIKIKGRIIFLSATINPFKLKTLKRFFRFDEIRMTLGEAIKKKLLPKPIIKLYPIVLSDEECIFIQGNNKSKKTIDVSFKERFNKKYNLRIKCTQKEYYQLLMEKYLYFQSLSKKPNQAFMFNKYIKQGLDIKKWLDSLKMPVIRELFKIPGRKLLFLPSIEDTIEFGNSINSNNKDIINDDLVEKFNKSEISYISSVGMLIRAMNLYNIEHSIIGTYTEDGSMLEQMFGRSLRYELPTIHIPYIKGTKDEEKLRRNLEKL